MSYKLTLIFLPLLLLGVVSTFYVDDDEDRDVLRPFLSNSQKRRICVELCLSGLGGNACGDECADITPLDLPVQSNPGNTSEKQVKQNLTRSSACDILCNNSLGTPLCVCDKVSGNDVQKSNEADFLQICTFFCLSYNYKLSGCQKCSIYKASVSGNLSSPRLFTKFTTTVDWQTWCLKQCSQGNGGAACNCDRLPLKY